MSNRLKIEQAKHQRLTWYDWLIAGFFAALCFVSLQQTDLMHTGGSSIAYLNGHFLDFYDYNVQFVEGNSYLPSSYILFAIWNIPVRLLGFLALPVKSVSYYILMWYKVLPSLFYLASGFLVFRIGQTLGMGDTKAKLCAYAFLTTPIGFFSQFIFGQYDSFTVFFMLLGILFFFQKKLLKFAIFTGISLTFKYFPLFVFIPLLFLVEKRIIQLIKYLVIVLLPVAVEILVYLPSAGFRSGVFGFGAINNIFDASIAGRFYSLRIFIILWIAIAAWAYFNEVKDDSDIAKWSFYYANMIMFLLFGISIWHPQWLLLAVPFWVISTFMNKKFDTFMIIDILMMLFFTVYTVNFWPDHVDQDLFSLGIFKHLIQGRINSVLTMRAIFRFQDLSFFYSAFSALVLVQALFKHPKYCTRLLSEPVDQFWPVVRIRFITGLSIFIVPAYICLYMTLR